MKNKLINLILLLFNGLCFILWFFIKKWSVMSQEGGM
jgi:hypothetical protein